MTSRTGQRLSEKRAIRREVNHWAHIAAILFFLMSVSGFLRLYGALRQGAVFMEFGLSNWKHHYLIAAGLFYGLLNLCAFILILSRSRARVIAASVAAGLSIGLYWLERFILWAPEQRSGNVLFMLILHLALLIVVFLFGLSDRKLSANQTELR